MSAHTAPGAPSGSVLVDGRGNVGSRTAPPSSQPTRASRGATLPQNRIWTPPETLFGCTPCESSESQPATALLECSSCSTPLPFIQYCSSAAYSFWLRLKVPQSPPKMVCGFGFYSLSLGLGVQDKIQQVVRHVVVQVPESSSLNHVMPYLLKLAISDPQLYWRLGAALIAMVLSKSAGVINKDKSSLNLSFGLLQLQGPAYPYVHEERSCR